MTEFQPEHCLAGPKAGKEHLHRQDGAYVKPAGAGKVKNKASRGGGTERVREAKAARGKKEQEGKRERVASTPKTDIFGQISPDQISPGQASPENDLSGKRHLQVKTGLPISPQNQERSSPRLCSVRKPESFFERIPSNSLVFLASKPARDIFTGRIEHL